MSGPPGPGETVVVLGLGIAGRAATRALRSRNIEVVAVEDRPTADTEEFATEVGCSLVVDADRGVFDELFATSACFVPSPGVPEAHVAFDAAASSSVRTVSEFDIARWFDDRPIAAITGTDGKTSVTLLTVAMLNESGVRAAAVGNTETPLVTVIDSTNYEVFVVEASSFRLGHSELFEPTAAAWLNFSPDHLDVHKTLAGYEAAKAQIWSNLGSGALAVAPVDDPVVRSHLPQRTDIDVVLVSSEPAEEATAFVERGRLIVAGTDVAAVDSLRRSFDHDITNALVASALALRLGATPAGIEAALSTYELAPHRIQFVATIAGIEFYNDSKATVPHAVNTAVSSFGSVVLIAGGKNKGIDLSELTQCSERIRAVVAIGDAADEVASAFDGIRPVERATDMNSAVSASFALAEQGDVVLLSPGCASFDTYESYAARGDDFMRAVNEFDKSQNTSSQLEKSS